MVELGDLTPTGSDEGAVGEPRAIRRLGAMIKAHPQAEEFVVGWTGVYASGARFPHVVTYRRRDRILVHDLPATEETGQCSYVYTGVTDAVLQLLAAEAKRGYVTTDSLTHYGCHAQCP